MISMRAPRRMWSVVPILMMGATLTMSSAILVAGSPQGDSSEMVSEFRLGVADVLRISVWKNEELSVVTQILPDGTVALPLIGSVKAADMTTEQLKTDLTERFSKFLTAPSVSVVVEKIESMKIFVTGMVKTPGAYDAIRPTRVLQALAMAGGLAEFASGKLTVVRQTTSGPERIELDLKKLVAGREPLGDLPLKPGDTLYVS